MSVFGETVDFFHSFLEQDGYDVRDVGWRAYVPIVEQVDTQPTLILNEWLFIYSALLCLFHAVSNGRSHVLVWLASLISGTANDVFFMMLPLVDNFWHAQCTLMITPRLPLYIPCAYICFQYIPIVSSFRYFRTFESAAAGATTKTAGVAATTTCSGGFPSTAVAQSACAALAAGLFYAPFDLAGQKFLWWTWHDTDAAISNRWLGVPMGSTLWTITHVFCFSMLLRWTAGASYSLPMSEAASSSSSSPKQGAPTTGGGHVSMLRFLLASLVVTFFNTPLMMGVMSLLQLHQLRFAVDTTAISSLLSSFSSSSLTISQFAHDVSSHIDVLVKPGKPDLISLVLCVVILLLVLYVYHRRHRDQPKQRQQRHQRQQGDGREDPSSASYRQDGLLFIGIVVYFVALAWVMVFADPSFVIATGVHQRVGECYVESYDLSDYKRYEYLCASDYSEDFTLLCSDKHFARRGQHIPDDGGGGRLMTEMEQVIRNLIKGRREEGGTPTEGGNDANTESESLVTPISWYPVCGVEHWNYPLYALTETSLSLAGVFLFQTLLFS